MKRPGLVLWPLLLACSCTKAPSGEGPVVFRDGGVLFQDGGVVFAYQDGGLIFQDGGVVYQDGGVAYQDGGVVYQDGGPLCVDGARCVPSGGECFVGRVSCTQGEASCLDQGPALSGTPCGPSGSEVCDGVGRCVACTSGQACLTDAGVCTLGVTDCSMGPSACRTSGFAPSGTHCGQNLVCDGVGSCIACVEGSACTPGGNQPCRLGAMHCGGPDGPLCQDTGPAPVGSQSICPQNQVCGQSGLCVTCQAGAACTPDAGLCYRGTLSCSTGAPVCDQVGFADAGTACGPGQVCDGFGTCTACVPGAACTIPGSVCRKGTLSCTAGPVCVDRGAAAAGTSCGQGSVCNPAGSCIACAEGAACTSANGPCTGASIVCASGAPVCTDQGFAPAATGCGSQKACDGQGSCVPTCPIDQYDPPDSFSGDLPGLTLGRGVITPISSAVATCVEICDASNHCTAPTSSPDCTHGSEQRTFTMHFVKDSKKLFQTMSMSAEASYDEGFWSAEASAKFSRTSAQTSDSAYLVLDVQVSYATLPLTNARLTPSALTLLKSDPEAFVAACGDKYVSQVTLGGIFRAIYKFSGVTETEKQSLETSFSIGGDWGGSASASFSTAMQSASSRYQTDLWVTQSGGSFASVGLTPDQLIATAQAFGNTPPDGGASSITCTNSAPVVVSTSSYYATTNFPAGARYPNVAEQVRALRSFADQYNEVVQFKNDVDSRLSRQEGLSAPQCAADYALYQAKQAEIDAFLAAATPKLDACRQIQLCGPSAQCLDPIPVPDTTLWPLLDPVHCGPPCTDGSQSTYESDRYGYCTRCTWTWAGFQEGQQHADGLFASSCRYMRPGASVNVRAVGTVNTPSCSVNSNFYAQLFLLPTSGSNTSETSCSTGGPCFWDNASHQYGGPLLASLSDSVYVSATPAPPTAAVTVQQNNGYGAGSGCWGLSYGNFVLDLCDGDRPEGCCLVAPMVCTSNAQCCSGSCVGGQCSSTCAAGLSLCSTACVDEQTDPSNCGACGNVCPVLPNAVPACAVGQCVLACQSGYSAVGGACVPTDGGQPSPDGG